MVRQRDARRAERGERKPPVEPGRLILQNEEELAPLLSEKAKEVLEKLRDNQSELNDLGECEVFVCGFRLGARIMLEVLDGSDKWGEFEE